MALTQTVAPTVEPVTLADAKNFGRVDSDLLYDDSLFVLLASAARSYAEMYTERSFITQTWRLTLDAFPGAGLTGLQFGGTFAIPGNAILLERGPVQSITAITYLDMGGTWQTMPSTDYVADLTGPLPRVTPVFGKVWPIPMPQIGSVRVDYVAGYGPAGNDVPPGIRHWIFLRVNTMYRNREEVAILGRGKVEPLPFVDALLDPYRVVSQ